MNRKIFIAFFLTFIVSLSMSQNFPFAHTYSIIARDTLTNELGVAVQSHWFSVGPVVGWAESGVGVIATQSFVNISFGPKGLEMLKTGQEPKAIMDILLAADSGRDFRQLAILDNKGNVASFTGEKCVEFANHISGPNYSVQSNLMLNDQVCPAMEKAFLETGGPLAERLVAALLAAQGTGGDIRGQQSASLLVVSGVPTGREWEDRKIDLRVEDHSDPVGELDRLLKIYRSYEHMNEGDVYLEQGKMDNAKEEYEKAMQLNPDNLESKYWYAVMLANQKLINESLPYFREVFRKDKNWKTLTPRLIKPGLLTVNEEELNKIMSLD
jgi:uncharacterized Ntn-hydrolase superfamily protein